MCFVLLDVVMLARGVEASEVAGLGGTGVGTRHEPTRPTPRRARGLFGVCPRSHGLTGQQVLW